MYTQSSCQNKCLGNFKLKPQQWRVTIFVSETLDLVDGFSCDPVVLNVSLVWILNMLGVKVLNLNLPKVQLQLGHIGS